MILQGIDFSGLGAAVPKPKKPTPTVAPPLPTPVETSKSAVPKWLPYGVGAAGLVVVIGLLITSTGKD